MNNQPMKARSPRLSAIARASSFSFLATALKRLNVKTVLFAMAAVVLTSCATHTVKSTSYTPIQRASENVAEEFLLDIGVAVFDPGLDGLTDAKKKLPTHKSVSRNRATCPICSPKHYSDQATGASCACCPTIRARSTSCSTARSFTPTARR